MKTINWRAVQHLDIPLLRFAEWLYVETRRHDVEDCYELEELFDAALMNDRPWFGRCVEDLAIALRLYKIRILRDDFS